MLIELNFLYEIVTALMIMFFTWTMWSLKQRFIIKDKYVIDMEKLNIRLNKEEIQRAELASDIKHIKENLIDIKTYFTK